MSFMETLSFLKSEMIFFLLGERYQNPQNFKLINDYNLSCYWMSLTAIYGIWLSARWQQLAHISLKLHFHSALQYCSACYTSQPTFCISIGLRCAKHQYGRSTHPVFSPSHSTLCSDVNDDDNKHKAKEPHAHLLLLLIFTA